MHHSRLTRNPRAQHTLRRHVSCGGPLRKNKFGFRRQNKFCLRFEIYETFQHRPRRLFIRKTILFSFLHSHTSICMTRHWSKSRVAKRLIIEQSHKVIKRLHSPVDVESFARSFGADTDALFFGHLRARVSRSCDNISRKFWTQKEKISKCREKNISKRRKIISKCLHTRRFFRKATKGVCACGVAPCSSHMWHVCQFSFVNNKSYQLLLAHP